MSSREEVVSEAPRRRGRPPADEVEARRDAVLDAAVDELVGAGVEAATMASIAERAGASKETLYRWFGHREGLLAAVIRRNADRSSERVVEALGGGDDLVETLTRFGTGLLRMLTSPGSLAINRAAMSDPALAAELLASGRHRVGPLVELLLQSAHDRGDIVVDDAAEAFQVLYGLLVRDVQIRCLLREEPPTDADVADQARRAVERFMLMFRA